MTRDPDRVHATHASMMIQFDDPGNWNETSATPSVIELLDEAPTLTSRASIKAAVLAVMAGASILANLSALLSIVLSKKAKGSSLYTLLLQLAVADLLVSIWCLSGEAAWTYSVEWKGGQALCKIFKFSQVFSLYLSTSTMVLIGFDRLFAIRRPINYRSCFRPVGCAWAISALLASPQLAIFRVLEGPFREPFYQCVTYGFYTDEWQEQLYSIFSLLTMFVIPLVALIICYAFIFFTIAKEKERAIMNNRSASRQAETIHQPSIVGAELNRCPAGSHLKDSMYQRRLLFKRAKMKLLRISIVIISAFVICWAPYYFMMITFIFLQPDEQLGEELQSAIFFFGMSNSLVNPLIYGAFHLCRPGNWRRRLLGSTSSFRTDDSRGGHTSGGIQMRYRAKSLVAVPTESLLLQRRRTTFVDHLSDSTSPAPQQQNNHQNRPRRLSSPTDVFHLQVNCSQRSSRFSCMSNPATSFL